MSGNPPTSDQRISVLALLAAVKYAKDDEDEAAFAACWATSARLEITSNGQSAQPLTGRDSIMSFYRRVWSSGGHGLGSERETHVAEHPHITVLADGMLLARHSSAFFNRRDGMPRLVGYGEFRDELIEEDGALRIVLRQSRLVRQK